MDSDHSEESTNREERCVFEETLEIGSRFKGYATPESDKDLFIVRKHNRQFYIRVFTVQKKLQNRVRRPQTGDDTLTEEVTISDCLIALGGIITGKCIYLVIHNDQIKNEELKKLVLELGNAYPEVIVETCTKTARNAGRNKKEKPGKIFLQRLFFAGYAERVLMDGKIPDRFMMPGDLSDALKPLYFNLMGRKNEIVDDIEVPLPVNTLKEGERWEQLEQQRDDAANYEKIFNFLLSD